jgi:hypothetical protein
VYEQETRGRVREARKDLQEAPTKVIDGEKQDEGGGFGFAL